MEIPDNKIYNEKGELIAEVTIGQTYNSITCSGLELRKMKEKELNRLKSLTPLPTGRKTRNY